MFRETRFRLPFREGDHLARVLIIDDTHCLHPILISKGRAPIDTVANGLEFRCGQRPVDPLGPTRWTSPARKAFRSTYRQTSRK
jgi:hypothetical protein